MNKLYALEVKKANLDLITLFNNGQTPKLMKKKTWFIFEIDNKGNVTGVDRVTEREMHQNYDIYKNSPFLVRLKSA